MLDENYKEIAANLNFGKSLYFKAGAEHFRLTGLSHYEHYHGTGSTPSGE